MEIRISEEQTKGAARAVEDGKTAGEMTYSKAADKFIIIDHTEVDPAYKGKGIGKELLTKIVEMAREKNIKIMPLCPFAKAMFDKTPEMSDVLK